jgi:hypothetical protein
MNISTDLENLIQRIELEEEIVDSKLTAGTSDYKRLMQYATLLKGIRNYLKKQHKAWDKEYNVLFPNEYVNLFNGK